MKITDMSKRLSLAALALSAMAISSCAMQATAPVMKPTGDMAKSTNGRSKVPVMKPTGEEKPAVDPANPAKPSQPIK